MTTAALTTIPRAWPTTRIWAIIPEDVPRRGRGTEPRIELLFGERKRPCPAPISTSRQASSPGVKLSGSVVRLRRPTLSRAIPMLAGSRWPIRSERAPLKGATTAEAIGIGVISSPAWSGV